MALLNASEARKRLGLGVDTFRRLVRDGVIPAFVDPVTGYKRYPESALDEWERTCATKQAAS